MEVDSFLFYFLVCIFCCLLAYICLEIITTEPNTNIPEETTLNIFDKNIQFTAYSTHYILKDSKYGPVQVNKSIFDKIYINDIVKYQKKNKKENFILVERDNKTIYKEIS